MEDTITAMYYFCDQSLKANGCHDDRQCRVSTAQVMTVYFPPKVCQSER